MTKFNIRCYAIIINNKKEILLSDEFQFGEAFTKFVGGGLEFGEGTKECLKREIKEELGLNAIIGDLFYVNDFYQQSAFNKDDQIISFYFFINNIDTSKIPIEINTIPLSSDGEKFRWKAIRDLQVEDLTFPIDQTVVRKIQERFINHSN